MTSSTPNTQLTGLGVLNDFSNELYNETMLLYEPMISGKYVLKQIRKSHEIRTLDKITNIDSQQQERIIDALTDLISFKFNDTEEKFREKIQQKIKEVSDISQHLELANKYYNNLNPTLQKQIIHLTTVKLIGGIETLRNEINHRLWIKNSNIEELMVIDQVLYRIEEILKIHINDFDLQKINKEFSYCIFMILSLEAYKRKKIKLNQLKLHLAEDLLIRAINLPNPSYVKPCEYKTILEVFGAE